MSMSRQTRVIAWVVSMLVTGVAFGQVQGTIINTNDAEFKGILKWKPREKAYEVTITNERIMEIPQANVKEIKVPKPKALTDAENQILAGNAAAAIPLLIKVSTDYLMLTWDKPAIRLLADAYLKDGKTDEAIKVCENVIKSDPELAFRGDFAPIYWQALQKKGNTSKVETLMGQAIKSGDRTASASALIMRGDLILATGDTNDNAKKALRDGYLRVVALYDKEKAVRPEALYKAAKCFEKVGQTPRADSFRSELKRDFAGTEWASKL